MKPIDRSQLNPSPSTASLTQAILAVAHSFGRSDDVAREFLHTHRAATPPPRAMETAFDLSRKYSVPIADGQVGLVLEFERSLSRPPRWVR